MTQRTCVIDGCDKSHQARGMCITHWSRWYRLTHPERNRASETSVRTCTVCGSQWTTRRVAAKFCSDECKSAGYRRAGIKPPRPLSTHSRLPAGHPVMVRIAEARQVRKDEAAARRRERDRIRSRSQFEWRTARECPGCGSHFTPLYTPNMLTCSKRCGRRVHRWRRRAREANAYGDFTWSEFMRIAQRFDFTCAYCGDRPGRLDPDHVVPLSRGGHNSTTNLLPACNRCNGDKGAMFLDEWASHRAAKGKTPVATNWAPEDRRYWHLTQALETRTA